MNKKPKKTMDQSGTYAAKDGTSCAAQEDLHLLYVTQYG